MYPLLKEAVERTSTESDDVPAEVVLLGYPNAGAAEDNVSTWVGADDKEGITRVFAMAHKLEFVMVHILVDQALLVLQ